jgi:hypothetical protein
LHKPVQMWNQEPLKPCPFVGVCSESSRKWRNTFWWEMSNHMCSHWLFGLEPPVTNWTNVRYFSCMSPFVKNLMRVLGKTLITIWAFKWLLSSMDPYVSL